MSPAFRMNPAKLCKIEWLATYVLTYAFFFLVHQGLI